MAQTKLSSDVTSSEEPSLLPVSTVTASRPGLPRVGPFIPLTAFRARPPLLSTRSVGDGQEVRAPVHFFTHSLVLSSWIWFLPGARPWLDDGLSLETLLRFHRLHEALLKPHPFLQPPLASPGPPELCSLSDGLSSLGALGGLWDRYRKGLRNV